MSIQLPKEYEAATRRVCTEILSTRLYSKHTGLFESTVKHSEPVVKFGLSKTASRFTVSYRIGDGGWIEFVSDTGPLASRTPRVYEEVKRLYDSNVLMADPALRSRSAAAAAAADADEEVVSSVPVVEATRKATKATGEALEADVVPQMGSTVWIMGHRHWEEAKVTKLNDKSFRVDGVEAVLKLGDHGITWRSTEPDVEEESEAEEAEGEEVETEEAEAAATDHVVGETVMVKPRIAKPNASKFNRAAKLLTACATPLSPQQPCILELFLTTYFHLLNRAGSHRTGVPTKPLRSWALTTVPSSTSFDRRRRAGLHFECQPAAPTRPRIYTARLSMGLCWRSNRRCERRFRGKETP